jgi:hypothetical protein
LYDKVVTLKSKLPTPIECCNDENQNGIDRISILWLAQMMGCQQALTTKRVWLSLVKCSATECECDKV